MSARSVDRTQVIRASVNDVEFTLALSIGLVVMVIFCSCAMCGHDHPQHHRALALVGTLWRDVSDGVQPRQSVADGPDDRGRFVVDDAIVMLENIYRHIEDGMAPIDAAIKGAGEIASPSSPSVCR